MIFSEKLKQLRTGYNLTQEELAEKINVSRQAITKWESGDGIPDIENLKQLSLLFDVTIDELVKEEKTVKVKGKYKYKEELEIDHTKDFDINVCKIFEMNIIPSTNEVVKVELISDELENISDLYKINFDNSYNRLDIDIKGKGKTDDIILNLFLPEKYINEIELNSKIKTLNISNLLINKLEYDGELKYLNVRSSKGMIVLNTTKCDIEADYDNFDGVLEVNTINSVSRVSIPKGTTYKTELKGFRNHFVDSNSVEDSNNIIELNGANSKLIIIEK